MAKRFTDTEIWDQDWYIDLPNKYKLLWNYIKDKCDNVGIWRPNKSILQKIIGEPLQLEEFLSFVNIDKKRIKVLPTGRWFLSDYFIFQYGNTFSPTSNVHKGALKQLISNGVHPNELTGLDIGNLQSTDIQHIKEIAYDKGSARLLEAFGRVKDKDKAQDKNKVNNSLSNTLSTIPENSNFEILKDENSFELKQKYLVPEMFLKFKETLPNYPSSVEMDFKPLMRIAEFLHKQLHISGNMLDNCPEIIKQWEKIVLVIAEDNFYRTKALSTISNHIQEIFQIFKNGKQKKRNGGDKQFTSDHVGKSFDSTPL